MLLAISTVVVSCNRYEWRQPDCPPEPPVAAPWLQPIVADSSPAVLSGLVVDFNTRQPLQGPIVTLHTAGSDTARQAASDGTFTFAAPSVRPIIVSAYMLGYKSRSDTLRTLPAGNRAIVLPMQTWGSECDGFYVVRVRKPWWKLW